MFWKVNKNSDWVKIKNKYFTSMSDRSKCQKLVLATTSDQITKFDQFNYFQKCKLCVNKLSPDTIVLPNFYMYKILPKLLNFLKLFKIFSSNKISQTNNLREKLSWIYRKLKKKLRSRNFCFVWKSSSIMWVLFSPLDQAFDKFLGTFYFGDLMVIFALEPLALSASLIEFLK